MSDGVRGRKPKTPEEQRSERYGLRLTKTESEALKMYAIRNNKKPMAILHDIITEKLKHDIDIIESQYAQMETGEPLDECQKTWSRSDW